MHTHVLTNSYTLNVVYSNDIVMVVQKLVPTIQSARSELFNPFTAPARKFSVLKSAHIHAYKQHI